MLALVNVVTFKRRHKAVWDLKRGQTLDNPPPPQVNSLGNDSASPTGRGSPEKKLHHGLRHNSLPTDV